MANSRKILELVPEFSEPVRGAAGRAFRGGASRNFFRRPFGPGRPRADGRIRQRRGRNAVAGDFFVPGHIGRIMGAAAARLSGAAA